MKRADYRTMDEDEQVIGKNYRRGHFILTALMVGIGAARGTTRSFSFWSPLAPSSSFSTRLPAVFSMYPSE